jgi:hypothetical protein
MALIGRTHMPRVARGPLLAEAEPPKAAVSKDRARRGGRGNGQEMAAFTSSMTLFSTTGLHSWRA